MTVSIQWNLLLISLGILAQQPAPLHSQPYLFLKHQHNTSLGHPYRDKDREDILAVPGPASAYEKVNKERTDYRGIPIYKAVSLVGCKPLSGRTQAASYAEQLLEERPDMPGTYVLWARPKLYQILWCDASGVIASNTFTWNNLAPLRAYIWSLYDPPQSHFLFDPSISRSVMEPNLWNIKTSLINNYYHLRHVFVGTTWGHRTNVWVSTSPLQEIVVAIKIHYPDNERRGIEEETLIHIHAKGIYPGVVRLLELTDPQAPALPSIITAPSAEGSHRIERTKTHLVMGSCGKSLLEAKSVRDILMALFDILESEVITLLPWNADTDYTVW